MANNYQGYILKFGNTVFPNHFFLQYSSTPSQRMDVDAERDNLGWLHRSTLPNGKTSIAFDTHIMELDEKIAVQNIIRQAIEIPAERKGKVTYWNDEINDYVTGDFYIPDVQYTIMDADQRTIRYAPITVELVEY